MLHNLHVGDFMNCSGDFQDFKLCWDGPYVSRIKYFKYFKMCGQMYYQLISLHVYRRGAYMAIFASGPLLHVYSFSVQHKRGNVIPRLNIRTAWYMHAPVYTTHSCL